MKNYRFLKIKLLLGLCFAIFFTLTLSVVSAQSAPEIEWKTCLGGSGADYACNINQTSDGGYNVVGLTDSFDCWSAKLDRYGKEVSKNWQTYLSEYHYVSSIENTSDGGYIVAGGQAAVIGVDYHIPDLITKLDEKGNIQWKYKYYLPERKYYFPEEDLVTWVPEVLSVQQTSDGGYVFVGGALSSWEGMDYGSSFLIAKLNADGSKEWSRIFNVGSYDKATCVQQTSDGGCIVAGNSARWDYVNTLPYYDSYCIIKFDKNGDDKWYYHYEVPFFGAGRPTSIQQTSDGGYIVVGTFISGDTYTYGDHIYGYQDSLIIKLGSTGKKEWSKILRGSGSETVASSVRQTSDGGYIVSGTASDQKVGNSDDKDCWIVKLNNTGIKEWSKYLGGSSGDGAKSVQQTSDGGYIIVGSTDSNDGHVTGNHGGTDAWVVKLSGVKNNYALIVGINDYPETNGDLKCCVNDANAINTLLTKRYNYPSNSIVILKDTSATSDDILGNLNDFAQKVGSNDTFVFYFSGHGSRTKDTGEEYICAVDNHIASLALKEMFDNNFDKNARIICIFDSCYSGGLSYDTDVDNPQGSKNGINRDSAVSLMSSRYNEYSWEGESKKSRSVFTYNLYKAFTCEGMLNSKHDRVSVEDAFGYASSETTRMVSDQHPQIMDHYFTKNDNSLKCYLADELINPEFLLGSLNCPAHLHAYDSTGRHTGLDEVDSFEEEIPESVYNGPEYDPEEIIILGQSENIMYQISAFEEGTFNFTLKQGTSNGIVEVEYLNVPVGKDTVAYVNVTPENEKFIMQIDIDGDGNIDELKEPGTTPGTAIDNEAPSGINNLTPYSDSTWINWTWINPTDPDFNYTEISLNGIFQTNTSAEFFNATGLEPETEYIINTRTVDISGNINETRVNSTATTLAELASDGEKPVIESVVLYPANTTAGSTINVNVAATDNIDVTGVTASGIQLTKTDGFWQGSIIAPSSIGSYSLLITAKDAAGNTVEITKNYKVVTPTGSLGVGIAPKTTTAPTSGKTIDYTVKIKSIQNFDDIVRVNVTMDGLPASYQISSDWFEWNNQTINIPSNSTVSLPLKLTIPPGQAAGRKAFKVRANSTFWITSAYDTGVITIS